MCWQFAHFKQGVTNEVAYCNHEPRRGRRSSRNATRPLFDGVEITSDTLTGRGGLALFSRYMRNLELFGDIDHRSGSLYATSPQARASGTGSSTASSHTSP